MLAGAASFEIGTYRVLWIRDRRSVMRCDCFEYSWVALLLIKMAGICAGGWVIKGVFSIV